MSGEKWTVAQWEKTIVTNCTSSYGLVIGAAALLIAENPDQDSFELLCNNFSGLSGMQAEMAKEIAKSIPVDALRWLE